MRNVNEPFCRILLLPPLRLILRFASLTEHHRRFSIFYAASSIKNYVLYSYAPREAQVILLGSGWTNYYHQGKKSHFFSRLRVLGFLSGGGETFSLCRSPLFFSVLFFEDEMKIIIGRWMNKKASLVRKDSPPPPPHPLIRGNRP